MSYSLEELRPTHGALGRERDSQRAKVYRSDRSLIGWTKLTTPLGSDPLMTLPEVTKLVNKVADSAYVIKKYGIHHSMDVMDGRGRRSAFGSPSGVVGFPKWSRSPGIVMHEMAHVYTPRRAAAHGWQFCAIYLDLVRHFMGKEAEATLKAAFKKNGVKFTKPRPKRASTMTPEAREALLERLAAARAVKAAKKAA